MKLNECEKGESYHVRSILVAEAIGRRLEALGVNEKTQVTVLNKKKSGSVSQDRRRDRSPGRRWGRNQDRPWGRSPDRGSRQVYRRRAEKREIRKGA